jgi:hypothetical protein
MSSCERDKQSGYCFVFNHFNVDLGYQNLSRPYGGNISKWADDKLLRIDRVPRSIIPTADEQSQDVADLCLSGIKDAAKIEIEFYRYKARRRTISFVPK